MKLHLLLCCALLAPIKVAYAADENGEFSMKGAGFLPCQVYTNERAAKSKIYYMIGGWMEGYISGYNKYVDDTYDVMSFESLELLLGVVANHCKSNQSDRLYTVINSLMIKLAPDRVEQKSVKVKIEEGERRATLYRETIRKIQARLTELGLYKDAVDGRYTDATRSALMAFQSDLEFEMTGFPDQVTLWRLLRK